jgi:FkbM family methyltransferase
MLSVKKKILIARLLNRVLGLMRRLTGRGMQAQCRRRGVQWNLDLNEGIDLSIYLLGAYEPRSVRAYERVIRPGDVVFDIGANIGAHTLHFARLVGPAGRVFAFEPTDYAVAKLGSNLALNPALAPRVSLEQCFLVADRADLPPSAIPSSWPVANQHDDLNVEHLGKPQSLVAATTTTADDFCLREGIGRIDFVKIDVDGHELPVLRGFHQSLRRFRPLILIEIAPFVYEGGNAGEFDEIVSLLRDLRYDVTDASTGQAIANDATLLRQTITPGGAVNALLIPRPAQP